MPKPDKHLGEELDRLAVLGDPIRRALYLFLTGRSDEVSRNQAAKALRISRALAAFHLDRLVEAGLLETSFRRLSGRTGPGAGRPSKLYRRSERQIDLALPARRYELMAQLTAKAMSDLGSASATALDRTAEERGRQIGIEARRNSRVRDDRSLQRVLLEVLRATGFEPRLEDGEIVMANCPFKAVQLEMPALTCGMNLALCRGLLEGLEAEGWTASLEPRPGRCCVVLRPSVRT